ncbi:MAG TPA: glycosyltransferase family 2 protein [Trueperaceae bacterium]|nr:glycosyltransferase family 2 protein [Trueperaceae bacterium]
MFSVIIPFRGDIEQLRQQLDALLSQPTSQDMEVIVADNYGPGAVVSSQVEEMVAGMASVRRVYAGDKPGAAYARNVGASHARGRRLAFVDADDVVGEGWVEAMAKALENHPVVASRFEYERLNPPEVRMGRRPVQSDGLISYQRPSFLAHAGGCGLGVRRDVFDELNGFDETYKVLEDTDFTWRVQLAGHAIRFEPEAVMHVRLRPTLRRTFAQSFSYGEAHARLQRDYKRFGMPRLGPAATLLSLVSLLRALPKLVSPSGRGSYVRTLGNRLGRWVGSLRYRVWAG